MGCVISWQPLTADVWVEYQASVCEVCGAQRGIETGFPPGNFSLLCPYYFVKIVLLIVVVLLLISEEKWAKPWNL
jgi:hypothetical protein